MTRRSVPLLLSLLLGVALPSFAGELVVIEARGVALKLGQKIDDTKKLTLADGQRVTLVAASGRTVKLSGPYDDVPPTEVTSESTLGRAAEAFEALKTQKQARLTEIGTVREPGFRVMPEPWLLNPERDGNLCVHEGQQIIFHRSNSARDSTFYFAPSDRSWSIRDRWPAGTDRITVQKVFKPRDKQAFIVAVDNEQHSVTLNVIPTTITDDVVMQAWMEERLCIGQGLALLKVMRPPG
jgi:hypothetical protein